MVVHVAQKHKQIRTACDKLVGNFLCPVRRTVNVGSNKIFHNLFLVVCRQNVVSRIVVVVVFAATAATAATLAVDRRNPQLFKGVLVPLRSSARALLQ